MLLAFSPLCREPAVKLSTEDILQSKPVELAHDQVLTGIFPKGNSRVVVRLTLTEPQMLRAELAAAEGSDTRIAIFQNSDRPLVVVDDRPEGVGEEVAPVLLTAGEARIEISAETSTPGLLKFFYRRFRAPADVEREPNQTPGTATPMSGLHASGFYGPDKHVNDGEVMPERDCFVHTLLPSHTGFLDARLTAVDGIQPSLFIYGSKGTEPLAVRTGVVGKVLQIAGVKIQAQDKIYLCITGTRQSETVSRDYYDLALEFSSQQNRHEIEPNDSAKTATEIAQGVIIGAIASQKDVDYFAYLNQREYPVLVRIALEGEAVGQLRLVLQQRDGMIKNFENSAPRSEVIENARLEAGESLVFSAQPRRAAKKTLKAAYEIKVSESQFSDENEAEPNGQIETADSLIDATYKWGFINPPQDVDYYRLQLTETLHRQLRLESKLGCRLSLEHLRAGKIVKVTRGKAPLVYEADFASGDLLRLTCVDIVTQPADRAYRIALSEP